MMMTSSMVMGSVLWMEGVGLGLARNIVQRYALGTGSETGTIRPPRPAASMAMLVSDAHANSPLAVKRLPKAGSRPGRGTRLEKPSSSELSFLGSTGRQPHHALAGRLQELLRPLLVVDGA